MKLSLSVPTGYNARELLLPLHERLAADASITEVHVITPAAPYHDQLFSTFENKFIFYTNPHSLEEHIALFKRLRPSVILTPTVGLDAKDTFILRAGKQLNIPTVTFIASWDNVFKMDRLRDRQVADYEIPAYFAVWNRFNYDHLLNNFAAEVNADQVAITGPPRFDYFTHANRIPTYTQLVAYLGFTEAPPETPLFHCATTELYPFDYILKSIRRALRRHILPVDSLLYVSVHPGGNLKKHEHYQKYGAKVKYSFGRRDKVFLPEFSYLPTNEEIYLLIALWQHASILINQSSTVALESMAADTPVVNVKYGRAFDWFGWRRSGVFRDFKQHYRYITNEGGTTIVNNSRELIAAIAAYLQNPGLNHTQRKKTVTKLISHVDGQNGRRLLDFIKQCAVS